jgi:tRNA uridine 5-carboxymethylaminomethyl modification enzyme
MNNNKKYDVLVVGGGHSGIEAAAAAARMGVSVCLVTLKSDNIGHMPCNPAIGGIGKGHIVFEISALGGVMPELCSDSYLQANMLNLSKGPAVHGLRLQIDKARYKEVALKKIATYPGLDIIYDTVENFIFAPDMSAIEGVVLQHHQHIYAQSVVVTSGTFLNGLIHMGLRNYSAGRIGEHAVFGLSDACKNLGIVLGRLKTGTPARLKADSIDFSLLEEQRSHHIDLLFEYDMRGTFTHKKSCFVTRTNQATHDVIKYHAHLSPIYKGDIKGIAPRYCPSIEDKIVRFHQKDSHHVFVEPEGMLSDEWYPNGLSTSLPVEVQEKFLRTMVGFEHVVLTQPGYAIEYDFIHPNQLKHTLELKKISGLFFAGQINGTTGYEEAAGQGIVAGINAAARVKKLPDFVLSRTESYIGVMIDDIITFGVDEPYRMFTSRAERRLVLRQDNVFYRLYEKAYQYGLISDSFYQKISSEYDVVSSVIQRLEKDQVKCSQLLSKNDLDSVRTYISSLYQDQLTSRMREYVLAELIYRPYYAKENLEIKKLKEYQHMSIVSDFNYKHVSGLSIELQQKLEKYRPATIAQASMIQGMTPAALSLLIFSIRK